jgi:predicted RNase H-like HicB family nuclease
MKLYNIRLNLEWDEASQTYSVTSPDVPQLFTFGSTLAEIQANV